MKIHNKIVLTFPFLANNLLSTENANLISSTRARAYPPVELLKKIKHTKIHFLYVKISVLYQNNYSKTAARDYQKIRLIINLSQYMLHLSRTRHLIIYIVFYLCKTNFFSLNCLHVSKPASIKKFDQENNIHEIPSQRHKFINSVYPCAKYVQ